MLKPIFLLWMALGLAAGNDALASGLEAKDYAQKRGEKVILVSEGKETELTEEVEFPAGIKIKSEGTFTVNNGQERKLLEGQKLDKNGMLYSPDGSLALVLNHVAQKNNRILIVKDGEAQPVTAMLQLEDGTRIMPDGMITRPNGQTLRMLDGQMILLSGVVIAARDTITFQKGKVHLQKDGSRMTLLPTQTMIMNDGTKVSGTGQVAWPDGRAIQMAEDQVLVVEGAVSTRLK